MHQEENKIVTRNDFREDRKRRPSSIQCERLKQLVEHCREPEVRKYLLKSLLAFRCGHLEAAVILAWAAVERYYSLVEEEIGMWYFEVCYQKANGGRKPRSRPTVTEINEICNYTKLFRGFDEHLSPLKDLRHSVAHGNGIFFVNADEVFEALMRVEFVSKRNVAEEKFDEKIEISELLKVIPSGGKLDGLAAHFPADEKEWTGICINLARKFLNDPTIPVQPLMDFLKCVFQMTPKETYERVWNSYVVSALTNLNDPIERKRNEAEIYFFIPRPPIEAHSPQRDEFIDFYLTWLENQVPDLKEKAKKNPSDEIDRRCTQIDDLLRRVRRDLPPEFVERWQKIDTDWRNIP